MTPGIGHNKGPELEGEFAWRRFAWGRARAALLPTLPIEVVRLHVARARDLGLPYKTYAGVRAASGRDVIGFLFSANALGALRSGQLPEPERAARVLALRGVERIALVPPDVAHTVFVPPCDSAATAPMPHLPWPRMRDVMVAATRDRRLPPDGVLLVGAAPWERDWAEAGRLAGYLPAETYFAPL
jgi:hypothetical protein